MIPVRRILIITTLIVVTWFNILIDINVCKKSVLWQIIYHNLPVEKALILLYFKSFLITIPNNNPAKLME